jgi:hypothetical protein
MDSPPVYGLPENPVVPQRTHSHSSVSTKLDALVTGVAALISFRERGAKKQENE